MEKGFTLVEILLVIAIIGLLAMMVIIGLNPVEKINRARYANVLTTLTEIEKTAFLFNLNYGRWPQDAYPDCEPGPGHECELVTNGYLSWPEPICGGNWSYDWEYWQDPAANGAEGVSVTLRNTHDPFTSTNAKFYICIYDESGNNCLNYVDGGGTNILAPTLNAITCHE
jgi:prepilin-type N-terminal cleavage/methylation domain-containing protein